VTKSILGRTWVQLILLVAVCALLFFSNLDRRALWPPDEPRYFSIARETLDHGDWILLKQGWAGLHRQAASILLVGCVFLSPVAGVGHFLGTVPIGTLRNDFRRSHLLPRTHALQPRSGVHCWLGPRNYSSIRLACRSGEHRRNPHMLYHAGIFFLRLMVSRPQ